ncbi:MAG: hypothetical protein WCO71_12635 [Pseudomonadota bacterium]
MSQTSRHISIGDSPDFVMRRGGMELNHQAVLKVYLFDSGIPTLKDSKAPFDKSLAVVVEDLRQNLEAYGWTAESYISRLEDTPFMMIVLIGRYMLSVVYKLEAKLTETQRDFLTREFNKFFNGNFAKITQPTSPGSK